MLRDSVVVVVVVRTRPRAIPLAMITIRKILHGFPYLSRDAYGAPLGGPSGRRSSAIMHCKPLSIEYVMYAYQLCLLECMKLL